MTGRKPDEKEMRKVVKEIQKDAYGKPDSNENFDRAAHQARNDAVGTTFQVREKKEDLVSVEKEKEIKKQKEAEKEKPQKSK